MNNLENGEVLRLSAYNILIIGAMFFLVGAIFNAASFGIEESNHLLLSLIGKTFQDTGTLCTAVGGLLGLITG